MTTMHEPITDTMHRDQEVTIKALQSWGDSVKRFWFPTSHTKVPSAAEVVDHYFDFVGHVLDTQRHFLLGLLNVAHGVAKEMEYAAEDAKKEMEYAAKGEYTAKDGAGKKG